MFRKQEKKTSVLCTAKGSVRYLSFGQSTCPWIETYVELLRQVVVLHTPNFRFGSYGDCCQQIDFLISEKYVFYVLERQKHTIFFLFLCTKTWARPVWWSKKHLNLLVIRLRMGKHWSKITEPTFGWETWTFCWVTRLIFDQNRPKNNSFLFDKSSTNHFKHQVRQNILF